MRFAPLSPPPLALLVAVLFVAPPSPLAARAAPALTPAPTPATPAAPDDAGARFENRLGLQLYSLRDLLARDVPGGLDKVKGFGVRNVELAGTYGLTAAQLKAAHDARGLRAVSAHFDHQRLRADVEGVARDAKILGLEYVGVGWIPHDDKRRQGASREQGRHVAAHADGGQGRDPGTGEVVWRTGHHQRAVVVA